MTKFGFGPIVVTGASGWVGRTVVDQLAKLLPKEEFLSRLRAFSSRSNVIESVGGISFRTMPLSELPVLVDQEGCSCFLHAAFLTPDRCADLGNETYTQINRSISEVIVSAVKASPNARVVEFSSGAASFAHAYHAMSSPAVQLYGALKLEEEHQLQAIAATLVLRIYALTGRHIRDPRRYAIGDFVDQALRGGPVVVKSQHSVVRGYVHADCLAEVAIRWLFSNIAEPKEPLNAITHEIDIVYLARCVAAEFGGLYLDVPDQDPGSVDFYAADAYKFTSLLKLLGVSYASLESQIRDTSRGLFG